ncbi:hypothetical protein YOLOSWAG_85 [Erwinia phage vB_EamM_Yoloswag]|uniref:Tail fiber protein n=1 Tax=Erwinia phage vB_EamM_Yoloswag TaxID=1958956 RepID=A0A1S6L311_9CAUD|nr:hypothetical protein HOR66_gp085 [Erwinia phage vB_EamM_Yoloswag]AQT28568.1 hypothetical protein YOLOSWAG_85 [Erwinia phage vB_EamM_Yoloswag]
MYAFGIQLVGPAAQILRAPGDPTTSGATFPANPQNGQIWYLTAVNGQNQPGLYVYSTSRAKWVSQLQSVNPYDVAVSLLKRYAASAEVARYLSVRSTAIAKNFAGSMAVADIAATAATVFDIRVMDAASGTMVKIGTVTFAANSKTGVFAAEPAYVDAEIILVSGDQLKITAPATVDSTISGIAMTIAGRLLV